MSTRRRVRGVLHFRPKLEFGNEETKRDDLVCNQRAASPNSVIPSRAVGEGPHNVRSR